jgi:hypothetical protein
MKVKLVRSKLFVECAREERVVCGGGLCVVTWCQVACTVVVCVREERTVTSVV